MSVATRRGLRLCTVGFGALPTLVMVVLLATPLLRPLPAAGAGGALGFYALTYAGAAVAPEGEIGAGGGLLPVDGGAPLVRGRTESAPSSAAVAASVEPGTLWQTVAGVANTEAGQEVIATPTRAEALYPGTAERSANQFGPESAGPLTVGAGTALAQAREGFTSARAELGTWRLAGGAQASARTLAAALAELRLRHPAAATARTAAGDDAKDDGAAIAVDGGRAFGQAEAQASAGRLAVRAQASAQELRVLDQLVVRGVRGHAAVTVDGGTRRADAGLAIASAVLGPFPVAITESGVTLAEQRVPADEARVVSAQLNEALRAAGVQVAWLPAHKRTGDGSGEADSGGLKVSIQTPSDGGIPGNTFGVVLGRVAVTSADETAPGGSAGGTSGGAADGYGGIGDPGSSGGSGVYGNGADGSGAYGTGASGASEGGGLTGAPLTGGTITPDLAGGAGGGAAGAVSTPGRGMVLVAGRALPASVVLAAFAVWQLLSLSTSTLAALALKRREADA